MIIERKDGSYWMKAWFTILPSYESFQFKDTITSLEDAQEEKEDNEQGSKEKSEKRGMMLRGWLVINETSLAGQFSMNDK